MCIVHIIFKYITLMCVAYTWHYVLTFITCLLDDVHPSFLKWRTLCCCLMLWFYLALVSGSEVNALFRVLLSQLCSIAVFCFLWIAFHVCVHCVCLNHRYVCFIGDNSSVIPVYHSLQDWFNWKLIKLPCFVFPDFRICSGMCSSKLPFASEKRYVNIFYRYYSATTKKS